MLRATALKVLFSIRSTRCLGSSSWNHLHGGGLQYAAHTHGQQASHIFIRGTQKKKEKENTWTPDTGANLNMERAFDICPHTRALLRYRNLNSDHFSIHRLTSKAVNVCILALTRSASAALTMVFGVKLHPSCFQLHGILHGCRQCHLH